MRSADSPSRGGSRHAREEGASRPKPSLRKVWPEVMALVRPRRWLLLFGLLLVAIRSVSGLVLPFTTRSLIDNVMGKGQAEKLPLLVGAVLVATVIQGIASFSVTQLLSKAAQRLISDLRMQVQRHIGNLPVSFYDSNRTGTLVSRIMTDVEGVRNLVGTGLVEFVGGVITAMVAFGFLMHISVRMTLLAFAIMAIFTALLQRAFKVIRPIFRERGKINAEVTGRLTESLGGVRVVKGYHAEEREAKVFAGSVKRLLDNVISSLTAQSLMSLASTVVLGVQHALFEVDLKVPDDFSLIGFDDVHLAEYTIPPLTTVRMSCKDLAQSAVANLLWHLDRHETTAPPPQNIPTHLIVRQTTGLPKDALRNLKERKAKARARAAEKI